MKYSKILNLPVIITGDQEPVGNVHDIIFIPADKKIMAIVFISYKLFAIKKAVVIDNISKIDKKAVWIKNKKTIMNPEQLLKNKDLKSYRFDYDNKKLFTYEGNDLGTVNDAIFNFEIGTIEGVEISDGVLQDIIDGRRIMTNIDILDTKKDDIFIKSDYLKNMKYNGRGLNKIFKKE